MVKVSIAPDSMLLFIMRQTFPDVTLLKASTSGLLSLCVGHTAQICPVSLWVGPNSAHFAGVILMRPSASCLLMPLTFHGWKLIIFSSSTCVILLQTLTLSVSSCFGSLLPIISDVS